MSSPPSFKDFDAEACSGNYEAAVCGQLRSIATRSNPSSTPHNCPRAKLGLGNYAQSESLSPPFCNLEFKRNAASCCCFSMAIWAILVIVDDEISDRHNETLPPPYFVNYLSFKTVFASWQLSLCNEAMILQCNEPPNLQM